MRVSVTQIGNNISKSEASIQIRTALHAGEMENLVTDQLEAVQQREHRYARLSGYRNQFETRMSVSRREKKRAKVSTMRKTKPIVASVLQYCSNRKIGILQAMDPTPHYKMMVTSR